MEHITLIDKRVHFMHRLLRQRNTRCLDDEAFDDTRFMSCINKEWIHYLITKLALPSRQIISRMLCQWIDINLYEVDYDPKVVIEELLFVADNCRHISSMIGRTEPITIWQMQEIVKAFDINGFNYEELVTMQLLCLSLARVIACINREKLSDDDKELLPVTIEDWLFFALESTNLGVVTTPIPKPVTKCSCQH